jgi:PEP-CTERM motif
MEARMSSTRKTGFGVVIFCFMFCWGLQANTVTIDLSPIANGSFSSNLGGGSSFPVGNNVFNGIPFAIPTNPGNAWFGSLAGVQSGTETVDLHPNTFGSTTAYTLLNTMFVGEPGQLLKFTFIGSAGAIYTYFMSSNVDYRDYNNSAMNAIGGNTTNAWNDQVGASTAFQRLDMQTIQLPTAFRTQILTDVILTDDGAFGIQRGIWSGLTIGEGPFAADPEPATIFLFASGLAVVGVWARKRRRA